MSFFEHLEELRQRLKVVIAAFLVAFIVMLVFSIQPVEIAGTTAYLPLPTADQGRTIPAQFIVLLSRSLVQESANLTVLGPAEAIVAQFKVAMFLAAVITSPISTYEFWRFVAPALKPNERRLIVRVTLPVVVLFLSGVLVSLLVVLPFVFPFLYGFAASLGATALLKLDDFLDFVLWFSIAFGLAFELPVVMYALSYLGIVTPEFWKTNWRYAIIAIFIFGAVVTPDGSGITMVLVSAPMLVLYAAGYVAVVQRSKHLAMKDRVPAKSS
jgi:sec-independent protein translocase protein TatC